LQRGHGGSVVDYGLILSRIGGSGPVSGGLRIGCSLLRGFQLLVFGGEVVFQAVDLATPDEEIESALRPWGPVAFFPF